MPPTIPSRGGPSGLKNRHSVSGKTILSGNASGKGKGKGGVGIKRHRYVESNSSLTRARRDRQHQHYIQHSTSIPTYLELTCGRRYTTTHPRGLSTQKNTVTNQPHYWVTGKSSRIRFEASVSFDTTYMHPPSAIKHINHQRALCVCPTLNDFMWRPARTPLARRFHCSLRYHSHSSNVGGWER